MKVLLTLLVVLFAALQIRLWFGDGSVQEVWRLRNEIDNSRAEVLRLTMRNQALAAEVADLKSGLEAIEERARAELGMIGEGEAFFQFVLENGVNRKASGSKSIADGGLSEDRPATAESIEIAPGTPKP